MVKFIDEEINVFEGQEAEQKLLNKNDKKYFEEKSGIVKVDDDRWKEAQVYERKTWCESGARELYTDRNEDHGNNFGGYNQLNFLLKDEISIIELGCGPYTNLRLIVPTLLKKFKKIDLLDPLIYEYIENSPNCYYKNKNINAHPANLISSTIEDFKNTETYDLVVMINVLEHCFDADKIFDKVTQLMSKNSIFLFHDKFYKNEKIENSIESIYDAGHPIKLSEEYLRKQLPKFNIIYQRTIDNEDYCEYYFILKLK